MLSCMGSLWTQQDGALIVRYEKIHRRLLFLVVEMDFLPQVYATTGLDLLRKVMNTTGIPSSRLEKVKNFKIIYLFK